MDITRTCRHLKLVQAKNSEAELIVARHKSVTSSWTKLLTDSEARTVALNKELHKCKEVCLLPALCFRHFVCRVVLHVCYIACLLYCT